MISLPDEEWRVEADLDDERHGYSLSERLRAHDLDDDARERLGGRVIVTRDGPHLYLYAASEDGAREAERVIRALLEEDDLTADVTVTRWDPDAEAWVPASEPTGAERAPAGRGRTTTGSCSSSRRRATTSPRSPSGWAPTAIPSSAAGATC